MSVPRLLKLPEVEALRAERTSAIYARVKAGLLPPPIALSTRSVAWVESEIAAVNAAQIAGATPMQIRGLVEALVAQRQTMMPALIAATESRSAA